MADARLKECPKCRYAGSYIYVAPSKGKGLFEGFTRYYATCVHCGNRTEYYLSEIEAIEAWNKEERHER
ncbi:MAG: hypothetical protein KAH01_07750 [Caldisericia bacterium]|nr:hypothetical protein [Caldisericia bacterium]